MIFKPRSKSNKNSIKDSAKNKKKKKKDAEDPKILDEREKAAKEDERGAGERRDATEAGAAKESETAKEREEKNEEDGRIDGGIKIGVETVEKKDGGAETKDKGAESSRVEGAKERGGALENGEDLDVTETVVTVEPESKTKDEEDEGGAEVAAVLENGLETDEEKEEGKENAAKPETEGPAGVEIVTKEIVATAANRSPEETQE